MTREQNRHRDLIQRKREGERKRPIFRKRDRDNDMREEVKHTVPNSVTTVAPVVGPLGGTNTDVKFTSAAHRHTMRQNGGK